MVRVGSVPLFSGQVLIGHPSKLSWRRHWLFGHTCHIPRYLCDLSGHVWYLSEALLNLLEHLWYLSLYMWHLPGYIWHLPRSFWHLCHQDNSWDTCHEIWNTHRNTISTFHRTLILVWVPVIPTRASSVPNGLITSHTEPLFATCQDIVRPTGSLRRLSEHHIRMPPCNTLWNVPRKRWFCNTSIVMGVVLGSTTVVSKIYTAGLLGWTNLTCFSTVLVRCAAGMRYLLHIKTWGLSCMAYYFSTRYYSKVVGKFAQKQYHYVQRIFRKIFKTKNINISIKISLCRNVNEVCHVRNVMHNQCESMHRKPTH